MKHCKKNCTGRIDCTGT